MIRSKTFIFLTSTSIFLLASDACFDYGTDYNGFDMEEGQYNSTTSAEDCQIECQSTAGCEYWTWDPGKLGSFRAAFGKELSLTVQTLFQIIILRAGRKLIKEINFNLDQWFLVPNTVKEF